jgi:hypothetical protein
VPETLGRILDVQPSVDSLERMNRQMAETVARFGHPDRPQSPKRKIPCACSTYLNGDLLWM